MGDRLQVKISCRGSRELPLRNFQEFQGELKSLSEQAYAKLRKGILLKGFSFPISVWKHQGKERVIDGHQRLRTLRRMEAEGIVIPMIPVNDIEASSLKEAKEKVLAGASAFGEMERQGLYEFMHEAELDFASVNASFQFPEIDLPTFHAEFFQQPESPDPRTEPEAEEPQDRKDAPDLLRESNNSDLVPEGNKLPPGPLPEPTTAAAPEQRPIDVDGKESVTYHLLPEEKQDLMYRLDELMRAWKVTSHAEVVLALVADAHRKLKKEKKK